MQTRSAPAPDAPPAVFDRAAWERAVMTSTLHRNTRICAFVLAHFADESGVVAAGGVQAPSRLEHLARVTPKQARLALQQLENWHYIVRPDIRDWPADRPVRPVALTLPPVAARTEPPHTDEVPSGR
ncbi:MULTISPECIES: hypothetical protein [unclassified Streptomyces]|uniref:hypothetical protein n=1 Tax=unclassified Streptomyces TaxID=2593676 RepID=UPI0037F88DCA